MTTDKNEEEVPTYFGSGTAPNDLRTDNQLRKLGIHVTAGARPDGMLDLGQLTIPLFSSKKHAQLAALHLQAAYDKWKQTDDGKSEPSMEYLIDHYKRLAEN